MNHISEPPVYRADVIPISRSSPIEMINGSFVDGPAFHEVRRWNEGRLIGAKRALKQQQVWAIRFWLDQHRRLRDRALFDFAIDSKLRGCDVVKVRIGDVVSGGCVRGRAVVVQQKTKRPVQSLYLAQYQALSAVAAEIRGSVNTERDDTHCSRPTTISTRWVFLTEMGGKLNPTMFITVAETEQAQDSFCQKFRIECTYQSHAAFDIQHVLLPQRLVKRSSGLDARFACIMQVEGRIQASIHETREEAEAAKDAARNWYGDDGMYSLQAILIPQLK